MLIEITGATAHKSLYRLGVFPATFHKLRQVDILIWTDSYYVIDKTKLNKKKDSGCSSEPEQDHPFCFFVVHKVGKAILIAKAGKVTWSEGMPALATIGHCLGLGLLDTQLSN